ncbi:MAG: energy transducer TonB [Spirochaetota bacterium]|nr:energy transducer TonB [Spirochaetota bacterium]
MIRYIAAIIILFNFLQCSLYRKISPQELIDPIYRTSDRTILNYEDASRKYTVDNINAHFQIHIEIDKPFIIESAKCEVDDIYKICDIEGIVIYSADIDKTGKIISYKIIKRAGLGFDEIAENIFRSIKISPCFQAGLSYNTSVDIRIHFNGKEKI